MPERNSADFKPGREQDAWAVLRGFCYQIDVTIQRWLELSDKDTLELERGEDIDLVSAAVADESDDRCYRQLEQVKVRDRNVTLRTDSILEMIANACEHLAANPQLNLHFLYTTNSRIAAERPNPFPNGDCGLDIWNEFNRHHAAGRPCTELGQQLRQFVRGSARPRQIATDCWHRLQQFLESVEESDFSQFLSRFEWHCGVAAPEDIWGGDLP